MGTPEPRDLARRRLTEVAERGAPALAREARLIAEELAERPNDASIVEKAAILFAAYLHDPYLTRDEGRGSPGSAG